MENNLNREYLSRLEGLSIESGKYYWIRSINIFGFNDIPTVQFIQSMLNNLFNYLFIPNKSIELKNLKLMLYHDFILQKYPNLADNIINNCLSVKDDADICSRYELTQYMFPYLNEYLVFVNNNIDKLLSFIVDEFTTIYRNYVANVFNIQFPLHSINNYDVLLQQSVQLLKSCINDPTIKFTQPWASAIYLQKLNE